MLSSKEICLPHARQNIQKAQAEIDKLEAEANAAESKTGSSKPTAEKQQVNGHASAGAETEKDEDSTKVVTEDLEKIKIEETA